MSSPETLRRGRGLDAFGAIAGGVVHDFSNLLLVIQGTAELLLEEAGPDHPLREGLEDILAAGERAAGLARRLLAFSRRGPSCPVSTDLNAVVRETLPLLEPVLGDGVELVLELAAEACPVFADPCRVEELLLEAAARIREALARGGRVTVRTGRPLGAEGSPSATEGAFLALCVAAPGLSAGAAFEHLGRDDGGPEWRLEREPADGAVSLLLALPPLAPGAGAPVEAAAEVPAQGGTILVIEDDEIVRGLLRKGLARAGYRVLEASGPSSALELSAAHEGPIDLVVSDVVMPGESGPAAVARLRASRPGLRALFVSGYAPGTLGPGAAEEPGLELLEKPFKRETLLRRVRELIAAPRP